MVDSEDDTDSTSTGGVVDRRASGARRIGVTERDRRVDARVLGRQRPPGDDRIVRTEDGEDTADPLSVLEVPVDPRLEGKPNSREEASEGTSGRFTNFVRRR